MTKRIFVFLIIGLLSYGAAWSQTENPDNKKLTKEEKKALREAKKAEEARKKAIVFELNKEIATNKSWVVEAHSVFPKEGGSFPMDPTINFVSVKDEEVTIQLSFLGIAGWNGVGGITLVGKVSRYGVKETKNVLTIQMTAIGSAMGPVDLNATVDPSSNGRVTVSGNWGDRITFAGKFVSFENSRIFKGSPTY